MRVVHLYTRQHEHSIYELKRKGRMVNREIYVDMHMMDVAPFFKEKYRRFCDMAMERLARPSYADYPIWTSISKRNCLRAISGTLVYCLEVPADQVMFFDGVKWDYVLNDLYIPSSLEDQEDYRSELRAAGFSTGFGILGGEAETSHPEICRRIRDSWERLFIVDRWDPFTVQANLWEIRSDWVRHIVRPGEDFFAIAADMEETFDEHGPQPVAPAPILSNAVEDFTLQPVAAYDPADDVAFCRQYAAGEHKA